MKPFGGLIGERQAAAGLTQPGFQQPPAQDAEGIVTVEDLTPGMVLGLAREKTPLGSFRKLRNSRVRGGWVGRRPGTAEFIAKPDSNAVLRVLTFITEQGDVWLLRLTPTSAHGAGLTDTWQAFSHDLTGSVGRVDHAQLAHLLFITNGIDKVRYIDFSAKTIKKIDEAPVARFATSFADRIVTAVIRRPVGGVAPLGIAWCEAFNPLKWTGLSSGELDLPQGGTGQGGEITGLFGFGNEMVILRRNSLWHADRQPFASNPMRFYQVIPNVGCDLPHTADAFDGGVIFADHSSRGVYVYTPGSRPQRVSEAIHDELMRDLQNLQWAEGSYDPFEREYHLGLSTVIGDKWINKTWVFSFRTGAWSYDDGPRVSTIGSVSAPTASISIDELIGTIDQQTGAIDDWASDLVRPELFKGTPTGEVLRQSYAHDTDIGGVAFEWEAISQNFGHPSMERTIKEIQAKILASKDSSIRIDVTKDLITWRHEKLMTFAASVARQQLRLPQLITGNDLFFRLRSALGDPKLDAFWMRAMDGSEHR